MGSKFHLEAIMLIMAYPRVDMFKPLRVFPDIYVNLADLTMDPLLVAIDQVLDDEKLVLIVWNSYVKRRPHCFVNGRHV
jgi:hypothetical protein